MTCSKSRSELISAIQKTARTSPSANELNAQRISFIMGSLKKESTVTRDQIQRVLEEQEGKR